jgi:hypothetical protein
MEVHSGSLLSFRNCFSGIMDSYASITGDLPPERILDQLRTRLAGLHTALQRMKISLDPSNPAPENYPLPPW